MGRGYLTDDELQKMRAIERLYLKETAKIMGCTQAEVRKGWNEINGTFGAKAAREIAKELKMPLAEVREILFLKKAKKRGIKHEGAEQIHHGRRRT